jgi:hypothetical protein
LRALRSGSRVRVVGTDYVDRGQDYYERWYQSRVVSHLVHRAQELGYTSPRARAHQRPVHRRRRKDVTWKKAT